jgi:hypothetical protein
MHAISTNPPSLAKVVGALRSLSNNNAPRVDRVTIELLKFGGLMHYGGYIR